MEQQESKRNSGCGIGVAIVIGFLILCFIIGGEDSSSKNKYSDDYYNNKSYREDVNDIADIYGEDAADVDRMIQAVEDAMNNN